VNGEALLDDCFNLAFFGIDAQKPGAKLHLIEKDKKQYLFRPSMKA